MVTELRMSILWNSDGMNKGVGRTTELGTWKCKKMYLSMKFCCLLLGISYVGDIGLYLPYGKYMVSIGSLL